VDVEIVLRARGRRESLLCLGLAILFGLAPLSTYLRAPSAAVGSLVVSLGLGLPLFLMAMWRLFHLEALALVEGGAALAFLRRTPRGLKRIDLPLADILNMRLAGTHLEIRRRNGPPVVLHVDQHEAADVRLRALADALRLPYSAAGGD